MGQVCDIVQAFAALANRARVTYHLSSMVENTALVLDGAPDSIAERGKPHRWQPGESGNPRGRPSARTIKTETAEAKSWARERVGLVLERCDAHLGRCSAYKDCAMCRHYNDMVMHYAYGKPPQRQELIMASLKADTAALAKSMGLDETQTKAALAEVERHYASLRASQ